MVDAPATRIDSVPFRPFELGACLFVVEAVGFGLALALVFGLVTALSVGSGRADEDGGVDGIVGDCDSTDGEDEAGGDGAIVRVSVTFEPPAEGCGSGAGESTVAVVGW